MVDNMGIIALSSKFNKIFYKDLKPNSKMIYCPKCNTYKKVNDEEFKQVRKSKTCPTCFYSAQSVSNKQDGVASLFIAFREYGYAVLTQFNFGKKLKTTVRQVAYFKDRHVYVRDIGICSMFSNSMWYYPNSTFWKKRDNIGQRYGYEYEKYGDHFYDYEFCVKDSVLEYKSKKDYLEKNTDFLVKSNQKKLVMDGLFTRKQMKAIKIFDLKNVDDVLKYTTYINRNSAHLDEFLTENIELNVYYLDYLNRNKIELGQYYTYIKNLKLLGFKLDKPKDFEDRMNKIGEMAETEKDKKLTKKIKKRYETLPKYNSEDVSIKPFDSAYSIRRCGKVLHNCIGGYVERYAKNQTDIYHLDYKGALKVAIEIRDNTLKQAYTDHNKETNKELMAHIKTFCNTNNINLGFYKNY